MDAESETNVQVIEAEYDDEGVYFYQAFNDEITDWAFETPSPWGTILQSNKNDMDQAIICMGAL